MTSAFLITAIAMLISLIPAGIILAKGPLAAAVVAYEFLTAVAVMAFALLAEGFGRPGEFEFVVLLALLMYGGGLVFVRAVERWL